MPEIYFVSKNKEWCDRMNEHFSQIPNIHICNDQIQNIEKKNTIFVSPSNSLVRMEGGMDYIMSRQMFPKIDKRVQRDVKKLGIVSHQGEYILPIGSSLFVENKKNHSGIIVAPTMFCSSSIGHTQNAYISSLSAFILFQRLNEYKKNQGENEFERFVITSHCCGNGRMSVAKAVKQMIDAYKDYINGRWPEEWEYVNRGQIETYRYCLLKYEEAAIKYEIDENDVKTIRFHANSQIEDL